MFNHLLCSFCSSLHCTAALSMPASFIVRICPISRPAILLPVYLGQDYITAPQACSNIKERVGCSFHIVQNNRRNLVQTRFCGDLEFGSNTTDKLQYQAPNSDSPQKHICNLHRSLDIRSSRNRYKCHTLI